uniref:Uncharacterized protein n=1 Tax=Arundo donax TaxID=35708 RepID=A0A0A9F975_ARUDO
MHICSFTYFFMGLKQLYINYSYSISYSLQANLFDIQTRKIACFLTSFPV